MIIMSADPRTRDAFDAAHAQRGAAIRTTLGRIFRPGPRDGRR